MGKKGIIGAVLMFGAMIIQGIGMLFTITDTTEQTLTKIIESDDEEEA